MSKEEVSSCRGPLDLNPRILRLTWCGIGEPERLALPIILEGSEESKSFTLCLPTVRSAGIYMNDNYTAC